ncbi:MAG: hypothetical protein CMM01_06255 [Rhodopirellula sp.]|nr:hypothetical protein [Rhodopirellula sp.]
MNPEHGNSDEFYYVIWRKREVESMLVRIVWIVSSRFIDIAATGPPKCVCKLPSPRKLPQ